MIEENRWPIEVLVEIFKWFSIEERLNQLARWRMKHATEPESEQEGAMPAMHSPEHFHFWKCAKQYPDVTTWRL